MNKLAFIFPGQGAQKVGMGKDFYETFDNVKEIFDSACEWLDLDIKTLCFEENDKLDLTEYSQPALVTTCLAMADVLRNQGVEPDISAGLSLGEYCAIATAGAISVKDAITTVRKRGILMEQAVPAGQGAMAAVLGMTAEEIDEVVDAISDVSVANYNCPGQIVITGEKAAVDKAKDLCIEKGARRAVPLAVSGAFHSSLLNDAAIKLHDVLSNYDLKKPSIPVYHNISGNIEDQPLIDILSKQIAHSVYFEQTIANMLGDGVDTFIEVGPGKTISGFVKKCCKGHDVKILHVEDMTTLKECVEALKG